MAKQTDFGFIRPLYVFCNVLGLLPPHSFGDVENSVSFNFKLYALLHIFVVVAVYGHSSFGREKYVYENIEITVLVTDKLANIVLTVLNLILRVSFVFYNSNAMKKFLNNAYNLSKKDHMKCFSKKSFIIQFIVFNAYMIFIITFDAYVWTSTLGINVFTFYIGRSVLYYVCNLIVFLMFESALLIKHLFISLNKQLETNVKALLASSDIKSAYVLIEFNVTAFKNTNPTSFDCDLRKIRKQYNKICDLIDLFNHIYGLPILMVILFIISFIINLTNLLLVYAVDKTKDLHGAHYGTDLILLCVTWMITLLIFSAFLAHSCANAVCQSENTTAICFTWLNEIPTNPKSPKLRILKDEILMLIQQTTSRKPYFSAAGFFVVDFTLLGFILGSVTSYIIISIQFMQT